MAGTKDGGRKAAATNKMRYGADFYQQIGRSGGQTSTLGGFASDVVGADGLSGRERAVAAGRKGGAASRRTKSGLKTKTALEGLKTRQNSADREIEQLITEQAESRQARMEQLA